MEWYLYLIAIVGSFFAGVINTLAGNGSAITLTILTELIGLPGNVANGTNRIGILTQSMAGTFAFYKNGRLKLKRSWPIIALTTVGAIAGVIVAVYVSNEQFRQVFRFLLVAMLFVVVIKPKRWLRDTDFDKKINWWLGVPLFLALGFYGGFIQMGMGVLFLAAMVLGAKYSITDANAVKVFVVALYHIPVIAIFIWRDLIDWRVALIFAIGQTAGGWYAGNFASKNPQANTWAHRLLVVVMVLAVLKVFW